MTRVYLSLFVCMTLIYITVSTVMVFVFAEFFNGIYEILGRGVLFGVIFSVSIGTIHYYKLKKVDKNAKLDEYLLHQRKTIVVEAPLLDVFGKVVTYYNATSNARVISQNEQDLTITVKLGGSFWSMGEIVEIAFYPLNSHTVRVSISSRPSWRTTLVDYGKNLDNINRIIEILRQAPAG